MITEVITQTFSNFFSFTTVIGVILFGIFGAIFFLRFTTVALKITKAIVADEEVMIARGCGAMILLCFGEVFVVFYFVVAISPKVLGFSDSAHWGLPFEVFFGDLIKCLFLILLGGVICFAEKFRILAYTIMSIFFYRVGYKLSCPEGYRIGDDAYRDYFPEFVVSAMIIVICLGLSYVSKLIGASLVKNQLYSDSDKSVNGFEAICSLLLAIIPIYMYGAWFSLKMQ